MLLPSLDFRVPALPVCGTGELQDQLLGGWVTTASQRQLHAVWLTPLDAEAVQRHRPQLPGLLNPDGVQRQGGQNRYSLFWPATALSPQVDLHWRDDFGDRARCGWNVTRGNQIGGRGRHRSRDCLCPCVPRRRCGDRASTAARDG